MRTLILIAGAALALAGCRNNDQVDNTINVDENLTAKQRIVFVALVLNGMPTDVLADQLGATQNAIYKMMFDARRKLRTALVDAGYLAEQQIA